MRKYRFTLLALICFVFLSTIILCSASWRILRQTVLEQQLPVAEEDTLFDYFTAGSGKTDESGTVIDPIIIYDGNEHSPTRLTKGETEFPSGITSEYLFGYNVKGEKIEDKTAAGTHHYKITASDGTDQVICYNHVVTITPDTLSVIVGETEYTTPLPAEGEDPSAIVADYGKYFERESFQTGVITWKADNSEKQDQKKDTKISVSDTDYSTTPKTLNAYAPSASDGFNANNYSNLASAKVVVSYTVLPKAKIDDTLYGSVTLALQDAAKNNSKDTVEALQSHTDGGTTYFASTGTNSASEGYFTHVIGNDSQKTEITINDGDILRIPNGVTAATGKKITVKPHASAEAPSYEFTRVDDATKDGLFLIYTEHPNDEHPEYVATHSDAYYRTDWIKNAVTVKNTEITNNGTIIIDAVVTGGAGGSPYNSIVFGDYSKITLDSKSKITNSGTINCYGFIDEETPTPYNKNLVINDNNVQLDMKSGTLNTIFTIVEHRGGNVYMGMVNPDGREIGEQANIGGGSKLYEPSMTTFGFNRYFIQSVSVNTKIHNTSNIKGEVSLFANEGPNQTSIDFMGKTYKDENNNDHYPIFQLRDNAYATLKYAHCKETAETEEQKATARKMDIDTYGNVTLNPLTLQLTIEKEAMGVQVVMNLALKTSDCLMPISHYMDISFNDYDDTDNVISDVDMISQGIKILPGGSVTIGKGVEADASNIAIYENNYLLNGLTLAQEKAEVTQLTKIEGGNPSTISAASATFSTYNIAQGIAYPDLDPGKLVVHGILNADSLGGASVVGSEDAILDIANGSLKSPELLQTYDHTLYIKIYIPLYGDYTHKQPYAAAYYSTDADSKLTATGNVWQSTSEKENNATLLSGRYQWSDGAWAKVQTIKITYNTDGGPEISEKEITININDGVKLTGDELLPTPTNKEHYTFAYWYVAGYPEENIDGETIYKNTTIYAKWTPINYKITLEYSYKGVDPLTNVSLPTEASFNADPVLLDLPDLPNELSEADKAKLDGYNFVGWHLDADGLINVDNKTGEYLMSETQGDCTLYGIWAANTYTFKYVNGDTNVTNDLYDSNIIKFETRDYMDTALSLPDDDENLTSFKKYVLNWQYTASDNSIHSFAPGTKISEVIALEEEISSTEIAEEYVFQMTAIWGDKYRLTYDVNGGNLENNLNGWYITATLPEPTRDHYNFAGWYTAAVDGTQVGGVGDNYTLSDDITLYAHWTGCVITYDATGGSCSTTSQTYNGVALALPTPSRNGFKFLGWFTSKDGGTKISDATYTPDDDITLYAHWRGYTVTYNVDGGNAIDSQTYAGEALTLPSAKKSSSLMKKYTFDGWYTDANGGGTFIGNAGDSYTPTADITLVAKWIEENNSCLIEGTMITLADGTLKKVEDLTMNDVLLVFNHETGKVEPGIILMLDHLDVPRQMYRVLNLEFSNGEILRMIDGHGVFDYTLKQYVFITEENMNDYVGHEFYSTYYNGVEFVSETVTMTNAYVTEEFTKIYCPLTAVHMNFYASGLLNFTPMPHGISTGHTNIFELDDDLTYNEEKMQADIEKYGLFTYEDLSDYLTEEQFNVLPFKYFKVSIGKGLMTWDQMIYAIEYVMRS